MFSLLILNILHAEKVILPESVPTFLSFSSVLGSSFSFVFNLIPRIKQTHSFTNETSDEYEVNSFTDIAVNFLIHNDAGSKAVLGGVGAYVLTILPILIVVGLLFLWDMVFAIYWCVRQCASGDSERPSRCITCRSPEQKCARIGCRICYLISAVVAITGLAFIMVASLNMHKELEEVFDQVNIVLTYFDDAIKSFQGLLDVGEDALVLTAGISDLIQKEGAMETLNTQLNSLHSLSIRARNYYDFLSGAADMGVTATIVTELTNSVSTFENSFNRSVSELEVVCNKSRDVIGTLSSNTNQFVSSLQAIRRLTNSISTQISEVEQSYTILHHQVFGANNKQLPPGHFSSIETWLNDVNDVALDPDDPTDASTLQDALQEMRIYQKLFDNYEAALNLLTSRDGTNCDILSRRAWTPPETPETPSAASRTRNQASVLGDIQQALNDLKAAWDAHTTTFQTISALPPPASQADPSTDGTSEVWTELEAVVNGSASLDSATMHDDELFHSTAHTLARASRYMNGVDEFVGDFKKMYETAGNMAWGLVVAFAGVFVLLLVLSSMCMIPCCSKDSVFCCSLCFQHIFSFIFGVLTVAFTLLSLILMDIHNDVYKAADLAPIYPVLDYLVRIPLSVDITDTMYHEMRRDICGITSRSRNDLSTLTEHEFLPFVCLDGQALGDYFLRRKSDADVNPVSTSFFDRMQRGFDEIVEGAADPTNYLPSGVTFGASINNTISEKASVARSSFSTFREDVLEELLSFDAVNPLLYNFLNIIFSDLAFDASLFWFGGFLALVAMTVAKPVMMCGRTGWVTPRRRGKKSGKAASRKKNIAQQKGMVNQRNGGKKGGVRKTGNPKRVSPI
ncbi:hypothetical protein BLNAU_23461 [Blattamonas nauphoetae]|uniref:Prominin-1-A n=1 Tax=Blattamonas nauphoetae TaxID=2049346 RepID=A0ABQ9WQ70_9EUKA|nr:hypothetical protein BLNAU_23461 [Blattamonas nauphoetae]